MNLTRRQVLSLVMGVYDPLGLVSLAMVRGEVAAEEIVRRPPRPQGGTKTCLQHVRRGGQTGSRF